MKMNVAKQVKCERPLNEAFLCDVLCFFAGVQSGQADNYCYSEPCFMGDLVCGGLLWETFVNRHKAYYPFYDDHRLMFENLSLIVDICKDTHNFIDLGPGSIGAFTQKTLPLLRAMLPVQYMAIDLNEEFARNVVLFLQQKETFVGVSYRVGNFFDHMPVLNKNSLVYLSGTTISNIEVDPRYESVFGGLTKALAHFGDALIEGGYFVFTYDSNQDEDSIRRSYDHPAMVAHNTNFIQLVRRELPTEGLCEEDFMHVTEWVPENHLLKQLLVPKRDVSFSVAGHRYDLEAGTKLHVTNCFKFTDDMIRDAARAAGFTKTHICTLENSPMRMAILEKK